MHRLFAILFVLIIGAQTIHQGLIYAYYVVNKEYISKKLCVNKDKDFKCAGKCHLKKVLNINKKHPSQEQNPIPNLEEIKVPILFFEELQKKNTYTNISTKIVDLFSFSQNFRYSFTYDFTYLTNIFHPPK